MADINGVRLLAQLVVALIGAVAQLAIIALVCGGVPTPRAALARGLAALPGLVGASLLTAVALLPAVMLLQASRNGYFFVLDRSNGKNLLTKPFAAVNWAKGIDEQGRPIPNPAKEPSKDGVLIAPDEGGATNFWPPSFDSKTGLLIVNAKDGYGIYFYKPEHGAYGSKGIGEPPAIPGPAAVANAIKDAVGVRVTQLPIKPEVLARAMWQHAGMAAD